MKPQPSDHRQKRPHFHPPAGEAGFGVGLDWIRLSTPPGLALDPRSALAPLLTKVNQRPPKPLFGYALAVEALSTGRLMFSDNMGWCLDLPGSAIGFADLELGILDYDLLTDCLSTGPWRATRLDLSMDVYRPAVTMPLVLQHIVDDDLACTAQSICEYRKYRKKNMPSHKTETLYIGDRSSERFGRIYDKQAELLAVYGERMPHCTRFEVELKGKLAAAAGELLAGSSDPRRDTLGMIRRFCDFTDPADRHRRDKKLRRRAAWWLDLVARSDPIMFGITRSPSDPARTTRWLLKSLSRVLALVKTSGMEPMVSAAVERLQKGELSADEVEHWKQFHLWAVAAANDAGVIDGEWRDPSGKADPVPATKPAGLDKILAIDRKQRRD